ncbi:hypothetical protein V1264_022793 [Littorina saxatilis]|uniref:Uncharacterized protein n=2 Tax=Littorina saxatilis TaxID=31220 RepID=A0AAN9B6J8_9CAEN
MLLEIWRDYQDETESESRSTPKLAEPPHVRDRLVQEICFLAENVRDKSTRKGMNPEALFSRHNSQILDYAEESKRSGSSLGMARPQSAMSSDGRETPLSPSNEASRRADLSCTIHEDVTSANQKLNYVHFGEVCIRLRETLTKEMEQLEADVLFLHGCLDNAADIRSHAGSPALTREPTIAELREERSLLEKELLSRETAPATPTVNKPIFTPTSTTVGKKMPSLGPINSRLRPAQRPTSGESHKSTPLRATHYIAPSVASPDSASVSSDKPVSSTDQTVTSPEGALSSFGDTAPTPPYGDNFESSNNANRRFISDNYDMDSLSITSPPSSVTRPNPTERHSYRGTEGDMIRRRDGSRNRRRNMSPAQVKVVPVGSILDPQADSESGRSFLPTPPPGEKPQLPRPGSADRFRKMVMQYREAT